MRRLSDVRELTALAHPVRMGIIEQLSLDSPLTATQLAERLDESPANCSWHLRKLAEHGVVEEAEGGRGRRRPWRMTEVGLQWDAQSEDPEERRAARALTQAMMSRVLARFHDGHERLETDGGPDGVRWRAASGGTETMAWLTADELAELNGEVMGLLRRYEARLVDAQQRPSGSRLCELVSWGLPVHVPGQEPTP